jgi:hypothetical protein
MVSRENESYFIRADVAQVQAKRTWPTDIGTWLRSVHSQCIIRRNQHDSIGIMISNAFGSLFASAILDNMDGAMGRAAWR